MEDAASLVCVCVCAPGSLYINETTSLDLLQIHRPMGKHGVSCFIPYGPGTCVCVCCTSAACYVTCNSLLWITYRPQRVRERWGGGGKHQGAAGGGYIKRMKKDTNGRRAVRRGRSERLEVKGGGLRVRPRQSCHREAELLPPVAVV